MGEQIDEIINRLIQKKKSTRYSELIAFMEEVGCSVRSTKDGCVVSHPTVAGYRATVAKPHGTSGSKHVKAPYIGYCIFLLRMVKEREETR